MQLIPEVTFRDIEPTDALKDYINKRVGKLDKFHNHIMSCRVVVKQIERHKHQGKLYQVHFDVKVPGKELVADRNQHEDFYIAFRNAYKAIKRQLEEYMRIQKREVKNHELMRHGRVSKIFAAEGYGFIEANNESYYFSSVNVHHPNFDKLNIGDEVQFIAEVADEGMQAKRINVGKHHMI